MLYFKIQEKKYNLNEVDFPNNLLKNLSNIEPDLLPNIIIHGIKSSGKSTLIYAFLASLFDKTIYDLKNNSIEIDKKIFNYKTSTYHMEFCCYEFGSNDKIFIQSFLKFFIETRNISHDIPKIIFVKNASYLSTIAQMALRRIIEKNIFTSRFIFELNEISKFTDPLLSRCLVIRVPLPSISNIKNSIHKMAKEDNIIINDDNIDKIIESSKLHYLDNYIDLKKIYGGYHYFKHTDKIFQYIYEDNIKNLLQILHSKKILISHLEKIREIINELYINLYPMKQLIMIGFLEISNIFKNNDLIFQKLLDITIQTDENINKGNKECIHAEYYYVALYELLHKN